MKRGFTLLELIVVIIIIGVLATMGIQQYGRMVERSRGAEARAILGQIRGAAAAYYLDNRNNLTGYNNTTAGIGSAADQIPSTCLATHYFYYNVNNSFTYGFNATATRCTGTTGKQPGALNAFTATLATNFSNGTDTWSGTGGY